MPEPMRRPMSSDEFISWAMEQPEGERYERVSGEVVAMSPERLAHAEVKALVWLAVRSALAAAALRCTAYPDGVSIAIDERTAYQADALVGCGEPLPGDTVIDDSVVVVEVIS